MRLKKLARKTLYAIFPHKIVANRVLFESNGPYDNGYSLFTYALKKRRDLDAYFLLPWAARKRMPKKQRRRCLYVFNGYLEALRHPVATLRRLRLQNTFSFEFSSYGCAVGHNPRTKKIYVFHGIGLKGAKDFFEGICNVFDKVTVPSIFVKQDYVEYYGKDEDKFDVLPSCRKSQLRFEPQINQRLRDFLKAGENRLILVMTTFRRNPDNTFDEKSVLTIPVDFKSLDEKLKAAGCTMVVKLHHALDCADLSAFPECSNVVFLKNADIEKLGLNPTSIMPYCDALITDYSSCATDFLLLDRPIGFLIPDFESYKTEINGGFNFKDPLSLMPGEKFVDQNGLEEFIGSLGQGGDEYKDERNRVSKLLNGDWPEEPCPEETILSYYCGEAISDGARK